MHVQIRRWSLPRLVKRIVDVTGAAGLLLVLSPITLATALSVRLTMGSPVLFRQTRAGRGERLFIIRKFRTMRDGPGPDAERLTPAGRWLRRTSLDELPQLLNVLAGDMSLVGPRPLLPEYLPRYDVRQRRRHEALPGITGWAQIHGRNAVDWEERFDLDVWYVDHWTLWLDIKILVATVRIALGGKDISQAGNATMPEFLGSQSAPIRERTT